MDKISSCCFTGHRKLPANRMQGIRENLNYQIEKLITEGVTHFISGGALGFDQIAASEIIGKKQKRAP